MPKGLYFTTSVSSFFFLSFFRRLISEITERISTKLGHIFSASEVTTIWRYTNVYIIIIIIIHLWQPFEKCGPNSPGHLHARARGQKNAFCDRLWILNEHISAMEHDIDNQKKLANLHAPKFD